MRCVSSISSITRIAALAVLVAPLLSCTDGAPPVAPPTAEPAATPTLDRAADFESVAFVVGPLTVQPGAVLLPDGRIHLRDWGLSGPATGDLAGSFAASGLDINYDGSFNGRGHSPAALTTAEGAWEGSAVWSFVGVFVAELGQNVPLGSVRLVLRGPGNQLLRARCEERLPPTSETLDCQGTLRR